MAVSVAIVPGSVRGTDKIANIDVAETVAIGETEVLVADYPERASGVRLSASLRRVHQRYLPRFGIC